MGTTSGNKSSRGEARDRNSCVLRYIFGVNCCRGTTISFHIITTAAVGRSVTVVMLNDVGVAPHPSKIPFLGNNTHYAPFT